MVRRRKSSSADSTRGGRAREGDSLVRGGGRGSPRKISEFLALLCASLMGFMRIGPDFSHDFFARKDISWGVRKSNAKQNRFQIVKIFFYFFLQHIS